MTTKPTVTLIPLDRARIRAAQEIVTQWHYLHRQVDARTSVEGYAVGIMCPDAQEFIGAPDLIDMGVLLVGRPEATRCTDWYGGVDDVQAGRCEVTRWQVLNLSRVWLSPKVQRGGCYWSPVFLPGFTDRRGRFRSTLASETLRALVGRVGYDYLLARPPCFLEEPYEIQWLLSYCDTSLHRGTIYAAAGFELYRTNDRGIQTWRIPLPALTAEQDAAVRAASDTNERSRHYRAQRAAATQMELTL